MLLSTPPMLSRVSSCLSRLFLIPLALAVNPTVPDHTALLRFADLPISSERQANKRAAADGHLREQVRRTESSGLAVAVGADRRLGLRRTGHGHTFDYTPSAMCKHGFAKPTNPNSDDKNQPMISTPQPPLETRPAKSAAECETFCEEKGPACQAAQFDHPRRHPPESGAGASSIGSCTLHTGCLERHRAAAPTRSDVMHRWGPTWPGDVSPSSVKWETNATLVVVAYSAPMGWLRTIPVGALDIVIYRKFDYSLSPNSRLSTVPHGSNWQYRTGGRGNNSTDRKPHPSSRTTGVQDLLDQLEWKELCTLPQPINLCTHPLLHFPCTSPPHALHPHMHSTPTCTPPPHALHPHKHSTPTCTPPSHALHSLGRHVVMAPAVDQPGGHTAPPSPSDGFLSLTTALTTASVGWLLCL